ncbi:MAG: malic enzyme-like NAD(P)-binding protein [Vampirovibrionales bacterium]|nr:malic enzyme-like NAD(P)-binding protein [Vampirovibrionales bacterium]
MTPTDIDLKQDANKASNNQDANKAPVAHSIALRQKYGGLLAIEPKTPACTPEALSVVYTPGVAAPCLAIEQDELLSFDLTMRGNTIAVVSDGSSVYGLGDAGPEAAALMLETKSVLHKSFAGIDAIPLPIKSRTAHEFIETILRLEPTFGGFHLDGIVSPKCFGIEAALQAALSVPVMHGEHSTAVVVCAGLINALKVVRKKLNEAKVVIYGAGTSGIPTAKLLAALGVANIKLCDEAGLVYPGRPYKMDWMKAAMARQTNPEGQKGTLEDALLGADVYIGYKDQSSLTPNVIATMAQEPVVFALAMPEPEIDPQVALQSGAAIVGTQLGNSPNLLRFSMAYPGIFRGALDVRATEINTPMLVAAAYSLAGMIDDADLTSSNILPNCVKKAIAATVARAVAQAAIQSGVAQRPVSPQSVENRVIQYRELGTKAWLKPEIILPPGATAGEQAIALRQRYQGAIETKTHVPVSDQETYNAIYLKTSAVQACKQVMQNPALLYDLSCKSNLVGVVTDGSAVLGLGNIGAVAGMPVMEGKSVLFKSFGAVEAFPICLQTQDTNELVDTILSLQTMFGGMNLEDITAPRCFDVEARLIAEGNIPVFHDDQHGTAVVTVSAILNAAKVVGKPIQSLKIAVNGAGAAALSVSKLLMLAGVEEILIADTKGLIYEGRKEGMNPYKHAIALQTNTKRLKGSIADAVKGADVFIGLSVAGALTPEMIRTMARDPVVLAMANPVPEILPEAALNAGAKVVGTGRSDFKNQVNNCLAFPGIFRGTLDVRARQISDGMKLAAAEAIAAQVTPNDLDQAVVIPSVFNMAVSPAVAEATARVAIAEGLAQTPCDPGQIAAKLRAFLDNAQGACGV